MSEPASCPNCSTPLPDSGECPNCATQAFSASRPTSDLHISGYDILGRIGEGGMGAIYLAEEKSLGRRVAIKVISGILATDPQARARFMREARSLATVEHPNVVRVYSFGDVEGHPYLAMEYVDGETLAERIRRSGMLPVEEAMRILRQILHALDAAWEKGIVHRDIKPSNVLIDRRGQVHVVDFGLAKTTEVGGDGALTQAGSVLGTPYYLAPEQAQGEPADFRADVYSCGILLFEMLTGERPFEGTTPLAIVAKQIHEPLPSIRSKRKDVPNRVVKLLDQMTQKKPAARGSSYAELLSVIDALLGLTPSGAITPTQTLPSRAVDRQERSKALAVTIGGIVVVILILAAVLFRNRTDSHPAVAAPPAEGRFVVAVAPFYGPDSESEREGRLMAAMVERAIQTRLGESNVRVLGIDETKTAVRHNDAARQLGERMNAGVVVWGEAFALRSETEIQPHFTIIQRPQTMAVAKAGGDELKRTDVKDADTASLESKTPPVMRLESQAPNQIELRKTSAEGVGEMVGLLAAVHALYTEHAPRKAIAFLDGVPRSADTLRYRAEAHLQLKEEDQAASALGELLKLQPNDAASHARLADLDSLAGRSSDAALHYHAAAASGQPYTSRYGVEYDGRIYQRETFRSNTQGSGKHDDTGYLLTVDPKSGTVVRRDRMPGIIQSFTPTADGFSIGYMFRDTDQRMQFLAFHKGRFDHPLVYTGGNLLLRMRAMKVGWILPANFMEKFANIIDKQAAIPLFRVKQEPSPESPSSLPELETSLRMAMQRDPTQPWHLFFLGQTLFAEGRVGEASAVWNQMLAREFAVPYTNWAWMAKFFERLRQREWADRAWARTVRERQRIPQPVVFTTLIERLINVPVMRLHPAQLKDPDRAYEWLVRARSLSGVTETDHIAAAAWMRYFERHRDPRAESERKFLRMAQSHPFNFTASAARTDYAIDLWAATWFGLFFALVLLFGAGADRSAAKMRTAPVPLFERIRRGPLWWISSGADADRMGMVFRLWRAVLLALAASVVTYVAIRLRIYAGESANWSGKEWIGRFAGLLVLLMFLSLLTRLSRLRPIVASLGNRDRLAVLLAFVLCLAATLVVIRSVNRHLSLATLPIGLADSMGHPQIVADFEERLAKRPTAERRYCAAVSNDYAGNVERAMTLYRELPDDPRAQKALAALGQGNSAAAMPTAREIYDVYTADSGKWLMGDTSGVNVASGFHFIFNYLAWGTLAFALLMLSAFLVVPPTRDPMSPVEPRSRWRRGVAKLLMTLLPGYYDVRHRSPLRGILMLLLTGSALCFARAGWIALRIPGAIGMMSAIAMPNFRAAFPMPPDVRAMDLYLSVPHAEVFYGAMILSLVTVLVLHLLRIPAIWRIHLESGDPSEMPTAAESYSTSKE